MSDSTSDPGPVDEARRRAFESTWTGGKPSPIERFLPPEDDPLYLGTLEELVHLELEFAWKQAGNKGPLVDDYLQRFPHLDQPEIVARLRETEQEVRGKRSTTFTPGMKLGRYQLIEEHARGGYGSVWRATDTRLGREVALKQLSGGFSRHADLRRRFVNEARVTARLEHPGIVPVYDVANLEEDPTFYAMKLVRGKTLAEAIQQAHELAGSDRVIAQQRLLSAFLVICQSMEYAHAAGVLHRDLKPQNIVLSDYGEAVILDWGLAKGVDMDAPEETAEGAHLTRAGTVKGTPAYMSPEQAAGLTDEIDERSDVYALGVILYQVLTGKVPFEAASSEELLVKVIQGQVQAPRALDRSIHPALEAICLRAMATAPGQRYQTVAELTADLQRFLADEPVKAWREPARVRMGRWVRRHRALVTGLGAAVVVAALGLGAVALVLAASNERLVEAKDHAEANLTIAKDAVHKYFTTVSESPRLKTAGLVSLRKELLGHATSFYRRLTEQQSDDPAIRRERGRAFLQLAQILVTTDSVDAAVKPCQEAQRIFRQDPEFAEDLAESHRILGVLYLGQKEYELARAELEKALSVYARETTAGDRRAQAVLHTDLGSLYSEMGELDKAEEHLRAGLRGCQEADQHPEVHKLLVLGHVSLAELQHRQRRLREAEQTCRRGIELASEQPKESPDYTHYRDQLAQLYFHLARILRAQERWHDAKQAYLDAIELGRELLDRSPNPANMYYLATVQGNLGGLYSTRDQARSRTHLEASKELWKALHILQPFELVHGEKLANVHRNLGNSYRIGGNYQKAREEFEAAIQLDEWLLSRSPENARYAVNLGKSKYILALVLDSMKDPKGALARASEALNVFEPLVKNAPESPRLITEIRFFVARLIPFCAERSEQLGRYEAAAAHWFRAAMLADSQSRPRMLFRHALAMGRSGDADAAASFGRKLGAGPVEGAFDAARLFAVAATAQKEDGILSAQHAASAVQQLERARVAGQLADPKRVETGEFQILKDRPDFQALRKRLQNR